MMPVELSLEGVVKIGADSTIVNGRMAKGYLSCSNVSPSSRTVYGMFQTIPLLRR